MNKKFLKIHVLYYLYYVLKFLKLILFDYQNNIIFKGWGLFFKEIVDIFLGISKGKFSLKPHLIFIK